jgi:NAD(P)-dependent dehydrogenase (short-subunit alcohol dehydrogenase family)
MRLENKTAIVTGAAAGIGASIARGFIAEGARVLITDIDEQKGKQLAEELGASASFLKLDVRSEQDWQGAMAHFDQLDILVNNAGITILGNIEQATVEDYQKMFDIDVMGVMFGCHYAVKKMKEGGPGSIINIASATAKLNESELSIYAAAKSAVLSFSKSTALYCAQQKYGVRCNAILPGIIWTELFDKILASLPTQEEKDEALQRWHNKFPMGRLGKASEISAAAIFLASEEESGFSTGIEIDVDGGATI